MHDDARNHIRELTALTALAELGPVLAGERNFAEAAETMLRTVMNVAATREGVLFTFCEKPPQLCAAAWQGVAQFPQNGYVPLLQRQVHALTHAELPETICGKGCDKFLSSSGNVAPELFKCVVPLRAAGKLAGAVALGARAEGAAYSAEVMQALAAVGNYVGLAVHNHNLA